MASLSDLLDGKLLEDVFEDVTLDEWSHSFRLSAYSMDVTLSVPNILISYKMSGFIRSKSRFLKSPRRRFHGSYILTPEVLADDRF